MTGLTDHGLEPCNLFAHVVGRVALRLQGWRVEGRLPAERKAVLLAAPHTSNWDFPVGLSMAWTCRLGVNYLGKDTLFKPPFGAFFRAVGGVPVDRGSSQGLVSQLVDVFNSRESFTLAIAPSATRKRRDYWKSGFYHIALGAGVPVVCVGADYSTRTGLIGPAIYLQGDVRADMDRIRASYRGVEGRHPSLVTPIRLREEDAEEQPAPPASAELA